MNWLETLAHLAVLLLVSPLLLGVALTVVWLRRRRRHEDERILERP